MPEKKLLEQVKDILRAKHYSPRTEETYVDWIKRYILFHEKRHPKEMGEKEIQEFITHLATQANLAASSQNQALSAIIFLYRHVLRLEIEISKQIIHAKKAERLPTVLSKAEAIAVLKQMDGVTKLMAQILYGSGLRLMECLRLRVKDIDFANRQIVVRDGKGEKDRFTPLPESLVEPLQAHLQKAYQLHKKDLEDGFGEVNLPYALHPGNLINRFLQVARVRHCVDFCRFQFAMPKQFRYCVQLARRHPAGFWQKCGVGCERGCRVSSSFPIPQPGDARRWQLAYCLRVGQ
jgi:integrase